MIPRPPTPTPFPYTTLFRSKKPSRTSMSAANMIQPIHEVRSGGYVSSSAAGGAVPLVEVSDTSPLPPVPVSRRRCPASWTDRSEEHTSELQSRLHLVCRLLL